MTGKKREELVSPSFPYQLEYLYNWFFELIQNKNIILVGESILYQPLSWVEFESWSNLNNITLEKWEIHTIMQLDRIWVAENNKKG